MTARQLRSRRLINRITIREIAEQIGCSYSWTRAIESGYCVKHEWLDRYRAALEQLIEEQKNK